MPRTPSAESQFRALIHDLSAPADELRAAIAEGAPDVVLRTDFPNSTVMLLVDWAITVYLAGIETLTKPAIAGAAQNQLRALIEVWALLAEIYGSTEPPDRAAVACRAAKFDIARYDEMLHSVKVLHTESVEGNEPTEVWKALTKTQTEYKAAHDALGCTGDIPRLRDNVGDRVEALEEMVGQTWLVDLWRIASASAHGFATEVALERLEFGASVTFQARGRVLARIAEALHGIGRLALGILNPGARPRFTRRMTAILKSRLLVEAGTGRLD